MSPKPYQKNPAAPAAKPAEKAMSKPAKAESKPAKPAAKSAGKSVSKPLQQHDGWLATVLGFLDADGWPHETAEDGSAVLTGYQGENGVLSLTIEVEESVGLLVAHAVLPVGFGPVEGEESEQGEDAEASAEQAVSGVAELCLRLNAGLPVGSFDFDLDETEVRFRIGFLFDGVEANPQIVRNALYTVVDSADRYLPLIAAVASGQADVESAMDMLNDD